MHDALDENAGRMDGVGIDFSCLHEMLDFRDRHLRRRRHHRIEIAGRLAIDEIAFGIALIGVDDRDIGDEFALHDIVRAVEFAQLLPLGNDGSDARFCEKCRECPRRLPGSARPACLAD